MSKKYKILPVKKEKSIPAEWRGVPYFIMKHPFCLLMNAPPKSGKSNLLMNLLFNVNFDFIHKFKNVHWCSPTIKGDKTIEPLMKILDDEKDNDIKEIINIFTDSDLDDFDALIRALIENQKGEAMDEPTLIILDDCIGKMKNGEFGKLCAKYRHFNFSVIGISQSFKAFDTIARNSASQFILFKTYNEKEEEKMIEELNGFPNIKQHYENSTKEKYNFLYINVEEQLMMQNFDKIIWERNNENEYCNCKGEKECDKPLNPNKNDDNKNIESNNIDGIELYRTSRRKKEKK